MSYLNDIIRESTKTIKSKKNKRVRWRKNRRIPKEALLELRKHGIILAEDLPEMGMDIKKFLELVWNKYKSLSKKDGEIYLFIYEDTVRFEITQEDKHYVYHKPSYNLKRGELNETDITNRD